MPESFTHEEIHALAEGAGAGGVLDCPRCAVPLDRRSIPPRRDVSYVRDRLWLVCPACHRTAVVDLREHR